MQSKHKPGMANPRIYETQCPGCEHKGSFGVCECVQEDRNCPKCGITWHICRNGYKNGKIHANVLIGRPAKGQHLICAFCEEKEAEGAQDNPNVA